MGWVESIQKAINYMEEHLLDDLTIESISRQANASAFHFQRTFTILTDISVGEYVRRRRLTLAAQELSRTNCKIIDLAYKYGYDTPEAFSKAFRRQHGVSPSEARKYIGKLTFYERLVIQVILKGEIPMKYNIIERDSFQLIGIKREFSLVNGENLIGIPKLWDKVNSDGTDDQLGKLNNGQIKGLLGVCVDKRILEQNETMDYWIATEYDGQVPEGYSSLTIPASKWVIFEVHGPMPDAIQEVWKRIFSEWFPTSGYEHAGTPEMEVYTDDDASNPDYYSEIWIPVK
ncbi:AraC family transcriptional regulator [Peribacillus butanolivorans]|uniref:AraC family transcriptional regulator n=2 Tax=Peribacillus butanolivorans TaxID=421767 RepID=A0AAX0S660_9BACI|nr:AraC family transcriptional regulator [Peribacillus butanolivorans]AXN37915.1 AraC family transcriptional regulator [Peribacillus butanolivorans]PEJ34447.1 AraC family transcriptional regulator [Peribacillus butanolivorans]QNU03614.1 AraC family transcriptional regulator [Peribacillus butanolivorans]